MLILRLLSPVGCQDQKAFDKLMEESIKMKQFDHLNVLNVIGVCVDAGPAPYVIMPFMANGSLQSYLKKERAQFIVTEDADEDTVC